MKLIIFSNKQDLLSVKGHSTTTPVILENNNNKNTTAASKKIMTRYRRKECLVQMQLKGLLSVKEYSITSIAKRDYITALSAN